MSRKLFLTNFFTNPNIKILIWCLTPWRKNYTWKKTVKGYDMTQQGNGIYFVHIFLILKHIEILFQKHTHLHILWKYGLPGNCGHSENDWPSEVLTNITMLWCRFVFIKIGIEQKTKTDQNWSEEFRLCLEAIQQTDQLLFHLGGQGELHLGGHWTSSLKFRTIHPP